MPRSAALVVAVLIGLALTTASDAAKVKVWHQYTQAQFEKAKFHDAVISNEGVIRLSRQLKPLANLAAAHVWSVVEDRQGVLYAATGDEGKLWRVTAEGADIVYTSKDTEVLSLAAASDGTVYAGTGPSGKVVRLKDGKASILADGLGSYVWSLAYDEASQTLYAGTGPKGKIYRIDAKGKATVHYATKQEHILALALGSKGTLYAGTDKGGLVYRIDPAGKGFVLYHANQTEVGSLLVTPEAIYAGTRTPTGSGRSKPSSFSSGSSPGKSPPSAGFDDTRPSTPPPVGDNSVYRIGTDGSVRELLRDRVLMLSLLLKDGRLLVGTGMQGQLFEIDVRTKERSELARLDHGQIHSLLQRRDGSIVLGTGDPGKLYTLSDKYAASGIVLSEVLDAKLMSRWGAMTWKAHMPPGTRVQVAVRTGNVAEPDETWSDWTSQATDPADARITAPTARYLQYRVKLETDDPAVTPEFRNFTLRYLPINQAPEISSVEVPDLDSANLDNPKKLKVRWTASDPNEDELTFSVYLRKDGWKDWVLMEENYEKKELDWDTSGVPSGVYQIKVVASDRKDNAPEDALTAERTSAPVPVAHAPPAVALKLTGMEGNQAVLEATATDPLVRLTEAAFAVNGKRWVSVFPVDGLFDNRSEQFRFKTDALRPGSYVVMLRVRNAAGSYGSGDVVLTVPAGAAKK